MSYELKVLLIVVLIIYLFIIYKSVKKKNLRINYLIFWFITGVLLIIALLLPNFIENLSKMMGFELPINMIFSIAIFVILYLIFDLTKLMSKEKSKNTMLIQEISMLKARIEKLENK